LQSAILHVIPKKQDYDELLKEERQRAICRAVWRTEGERNSKARTCAGDRELAQSKRAKARAALGKEKKINRAPQTCGATEKLVTTACDYFMIGSCLFGSTTVHF
jgi:hypothetical protein